MADTAKDIPRPPTIFFKGQQTVFLFFKQDGFIGESLFPKNKFNSRFHSLKTLSRSALRYNIEHIFSSLIQDLCLAGKRLEGFDSFCYTSFASYNRCMYSNHVGTEQVALM